MSGDQELQVLAGLIRDVRGRTGLTLRQLGDILHVSDSSLSRYCTGQTLPSWEVVAALAELAGAEARELAPAWEAAAAARRRQSGPSAIQVPARSDVCPGLRTGLVVAALMAATGVVTHLVSRRLPRR